MEIWGDFIATFALAAFAMMVIQPRNRLSTTIFSVLAIAIIINCWAFLLVSIWI